MDESKPVKYAVWELADQTIVYVCPRGADPELGCNFGDQWGVTTKHPLATLFETREEAREVLKQLQSTYTPERFERFGNDGGAEVEVVFDEAEFRGREDTWLEFYERRGKGSVRGVMSSKTICPCCGVDAVSDPTLFDLCPGCMGEVNDDLMEVAAAVSEVIKPALETCPCLGVCPECAEPTAPDEWAVEDVCINCYQGPSPLG